MEAQAVLCANAGHKEQVLLKKKIISCIKKHMSFYRDSSTSIYLKNHLLCQLKYIPSETHILEKLHNTIHHWGETSLQFFSSSRGKLEARTAESNLSSFVNPSALAARLNTLSHINQEQALNITYCKIHMHTGSPAGQLLHLSVHQMKEQLWPCICQTSGELLGSTERKAPLKTRSPLQTTTMALLLLLFPTGQSSGSGKYASFNAQGSGAEDAELLRKYGMWHWNEELREKQWQEQVSRGADSLGGSDVIAMAASDWPWQMCVFYRSSTDHTSLHRSKPTRTPAAV